MSSGVTDEPAALCARAGVRAPLGPGCGIGRFAAERQTDSEIDLIVRRINIAESRRRGSSSAN